MAVTPRAANVGTAAHSVTLPARPLTVGKRGPRVGLAAVILLAWGFAFGASLSGLAAAVAATVLAWIVGSAVLRDRGEYQRALAVRIVRHAQAAALVTALVVASDAVVGSDTPVFRLLAPGCSASSRSPAGTCAGTARTTATARCVCSVSEPARRPPGCFAHSRRARPMASSSSASSATTRTRSSRCSAELEDLPAILRRHDIDAIVLTANRHRLPLLDHLLGVGDRTPALLEMTDLFERAFGCVPVEEINAAWFFESLTLHRRLQASPARRAFDIGVAAVAAALTLPVTLVVALAIKLDSPGPVFYRQVRVGEGGRPFTIIKFRSMRTDAEIAGRPQWAAESDPRVTRVGALIRRYRIDELPQLWNVVRGDMALVGPRPERPELVAEIARELPFYEPRRLVRPGITGWAQVYAPYAASIEETLEKLSYDLYYVKHQSFATDAGIMLSTLGVMAGGRGAR